MATTKTIKTVTVTDVIAVTQKMGDTLVNQFNKNKDLKVAQLSLSSYKTAINGAKAQLIYKKLTGNPDKIGFFETNTVVDKKQTTTRK
jgi:hypothetical protein